MIRALYNLLFPVVFLGMLPGFLLRMIRRGKYRHRFGQRLGIYSERTRRALGGRSPVWIHAVSVGEVNVAIRLIQAWRRRHPGLPFVLSTTTSTGLALAEERAPAECLCIYNPVDFPPVVASALGLIAPRMLVLVEAEVWPNLVAGARRIGAPVALVNARLSPRSERRFVRFRALAGPLFRELDAVCVQDADDLEVWRRIGVGPARLHLCGGIKYDDPADPAVPGRVAALRDVLRAARNDRDGPVFLGGSTHPGEEAVLADAFLRLRDAHPDLTLCVAPRHVERSAEAEADLRAAGLSVLRRSALGGEPGGQRPDCLLLDTTGELGAWYHLADVAFIGKSLTARGGQNPVEAIHAGCAVLCGPHMDNFRALMKSLDRHRAVLRVADSADMAAAADRLLHSADERAALASAARAALDIHRGATMRTVQILESLPPVPVPG